MDKHKIAKDYLEMVQKCDKFVDKLPHSISPAFFDNEYTDAQITLINKLLKQCLTNEQYEDLMYFAHEDCPVTYYDGYQFTDVFSYWAYKYSIE